MAYHPEDNGSFCATCGREQEPGARFCPNCGAEAGGGPGMAYPPGGELTAGVEYMGFWIRVAAALIDITLVSIVAAIVGLVLRLLLGDGPANFIGMVIGWIYHVAFIAAKGQTLGKMAVGIQVVNREGNIPGFGAVLLREIVGKFLSFIALLLGYLWVGWDQEKRGWHDHIGGTWVVWKHHGSAGPTYDIHRPVPNYLAQAILVTFCCVPFGIVAIANAAQVNRKLAAGDYAGALNDSNSAKGWCWAAFWTGLVSGILYILVTLAFTMG